jgi:hypothetical protein
VSDVESFSDQDSLPTARRTTIGRGNHPNSRSTLARYQFRPGESGNPSGRPKHDKARDIARAIFEQNPEAIYEAMGKALLKGKPHVFKGLAERAFGRVPQGLEIAGPDGGPVEYRDLSDHQLDERFREVQNQIDSALTETELDARIRDLQERLNAKRTERGAS